MSPKLFSFSFDRGRGLSIIEADSETSHPNTQHPTPNTQLHYPMKAAFDPIAKTSYASSHRRESAGLHYEFAMLIPSTYRPGEAQSIVTLRLYRPGTVCYACLWVDADPVHTRGSGKAGGYGYCKSSSAAGQAIRNAGFTLDRHIDGAGISAIREAMHALAAELGHPEALLHEAHA